MPCGVRKSNFAPNSPAAWVIRSSVDTTPLTCGRQASVAMRMRIYAASASGLFAIVLEGTVVLDRRADRQRPRPAQDFQPAVTMLDHQRAGFDEVAGVDIGHAVDVADDRVMDMTADDAVDAAPPGFAGELASRTSR